MALQTTYKQFLAAPKESALASNASLHYITTLVTLNGPAAIIKHINVQSHDLKKKEEKILDVVEAANALAIEISTTIEFVTGGGSYLPGLDDNFVADRVVTLPIIHMVSFNSDGQIQQIRLSWDQGALLKLIDVIGRTGRNWPIRDGVDQIKLIASSVKSAGEVESEGHNTRPRGISNNVTGDPHASLSLFQPRDKSYQDSLPGVVPPRASAKPAPRNYHDLFVGQDSEGNSPVPGSDHSRELSDSSNVAPKGGAGKNYHPSRLFDLPDEVNPSPNKIGNPSKYNHFDLAEGGGEDRTEKRPPLKEVQSSKHSSQWNFDDFNTPQKVIPSKVLRANDVRHWGNSDDEVIDSPVKIKKVDRPRKDAETHFEFQDDGSPDGPRLIGRPRGPGASNANGIYKNDMFDGSEDETTGGAIKPSLANVKERSKDFNPQFAMTDDSPASKPGSQRIPEDRAKVLKNMDANWASYDQSPNQKENNLRSPAGLRPNSSNRPLSETTNSSNRIDQPKGITIAGDGMGGRKTVFAAEEASKGITIAGDGMGGRKGAGRIAQSFKGITVGGDGMGGKKGASRQWGFGDESDGEEAGGANVPTKYRTGKTQGKTQQPTGGDFWDF
ncbi:hypothetical protein PZA11_003669 [Diplocarpon coronariae]|uniref:Uncharacterized protein n=1 Tax=Diplocarpon coronariae TaxID=2795749 RepID=A0A218YZD2_9HELO|nr:hypothetical protein JHW43_008071 [Diplocarpon mali]OWP00405.1 hypothetical protein B2J93_3955 [Marssonina coronariae]